MSTGRIPWFEQINMKFNSLFGLEFQPLLLSIAIENIHVSLRVERAIARVIFKIQIFTHFVQRDEGKMKGQLKVGPLAMSRFDR